MTAILFRLGTVGATGEYLGPRPRVGAYFDRLKARPSFKTAFGPASSTWVQISSILPNLIKAKLGCSS